MIEKQEFEFGSRDGEHRLHTVKWIPETKPPVCILQIVHGMDEHIGRYEDFALAMAKRGILVVGDDHLGHGLSVKPGEPKGYFCREDAATVLVRDEHRLKKIMQEQYPGVPYAILGHSMGSFILRNYLLRYGSGIDAAIVMGTGMPSKGSALFGLALAKLMGTVRGQTYACALIDKIVFGSYNRQIAKLGGLGSWISANPENVRRYREDPLCGFTFTANGFQTLFQLILNLHDSEKLKNMPQNLPVLFVAGKDDPVGDCGKGVEAVFHSFEKAGLEQAQLKLYPGDRHEILNEKDCETVYNDIYRFLLQKVV